ncbi:16S rRNA (guanine(966)-N(2))-methyltransferase RsmD [Lederbergia sp. NSJ-179]|uniref:16S rRNA (guanine(966)-N(2))-methyltransferase RsmD n=1 Tax=Lederbergia sp. NSJ-179 TaxID=2931402 RepID=UPI001FD4483E|nr:16S rRNA (guanine(966)-N(2))-methyltransferase RsmD [Lederbergia sp. NSJ-179]MCJ7839533.1 16S rRNA (guanine(966)-N(2))-methyltransferase RsmD [Lederbergia sp. NSJ-179]
MRIISGDLKGRPLKAVPGNGTRPTTDKVKETLFNMIGPYFTGGVALDLFAGSGALGIEGLSRGMDKVIFIDKDRQAIQTIKKNIDYCGLENQSEIYRNDAERALKALVKRKLQFDYIFLDPPYHHQKLESLLNTIEKNNLLHSQGLIIVEHDSELSLPRKVGDLEQRKTAHYGITALSIYHLIEK